MADAGSAAVAPTILGAGATTTSPEKDSAEARARGTAEISLPAASSTAQTTVEAPSASSPPPVAGIPVFVPFAPPPRSPPVTAARQSISSRRNFPDPRRVSGSSASVSSSSSSSGSTDGGSACSPGRAQARAKSSARGSSEARRARAGGTRASRSNSPPQRPPGGGSAGLGFSYGGPIPGAMPAATIAGVAGPGGGSLSGMYFGALGVGSWGVSGPGSAAPQFQQSMYPVNLPPISPASATSSGKFVLGVSPASATSHRGFSVASSVTSGSELMYSPSAGELSSTGRESHHSLHHHTRVRPGAREPQAPALGSSAKGFSRARAGSNSSSEGGNVQRGGGVDRHRADGNGDDGNSGNSGGRAMNPGGDVDTSLERLRGTSTSKDVGSGGMSEASVEAVATCDYENSEHSGEDVDDGVSSTFSRGSLLAGEFTFAIPSNRTPA
ncbi:unnamed protein product, partial [Ascophyllum nodosum]